VRRGSKCCAAHGIVNADSIGTVNLSMKKAKSVLLRATKRLIATGIVIRRRLTGTLQRCEQPGLEIAGSLRLFCKIGDGPQSPKRK
jgi:hypothetical protein